jgi:hypothetical protein
MEEKVEALSSLVEVLFPPGILLCMWILSIVENPEFHKFNMKIKS